MLRNLVSLTAKLFKGIYSIGGSNKCFYACLLSHFSCVQLFVTPWMVAHQAPLSRGFSRQEYWSVSLCPPPRNLPDPGIESTFTYVSCIGRQVLDHYCHPGSPRILEWVVISFSGDISNTGVEPVFPGTVAQAGGFFTSEPWRFP